MKTYYEVKVKYDKLNHQGKLQKVTEPYLIDAVSFGDAETRISEIMSKQLSGEFELKADKIVNIVDVHCLQYGEIYFKAKSFILTTDAKGKEKKVYEYYLVKADTINSAFNWAVDNLPCDGIVSFSETNIVDVF